MLTGSGGATWDGSRWMIPQQAGSAGVRLTETLPLSGRSWTVRVDQIPNAASGLRSLTLEVKRVKYPTRYALRVLQSGGKLSVRQVHNGSQSSLCPDVTYSPVGMRWWRVRDDGTRTWFEVSPDGTAWTARVSVPSPGWLLEECSYSLVAWTGAGGSSGSVVAAAPTLAAPMTAAQMSAVPLPRDVLFRRDSFWYRPLSADAPLHPSSEQWARNLCEQMRLNPVTGGPDGSGDHTKASYGGMFHAYVVPPNHPLTPFRLASEVGEEPRLYGINSVELDSELQKGVPLPPGATVSGGTDTYLFIADPAARTTWELWKVYQHPSKGWLCGWGGVMRRTDESVGTYETLKNLDGTLRQSRYWGPSAANMPLLGGVVTVEDVKLKRHHTLQMSVGNAATTFVWPANRCDGWHGPEWIHQGARVRFPAEYTVAQARAQLRVDFSRMTSVQRDQTLEFFDYLFLSIRDYGVIPVDKTLQGCVIHKLGHQPGSGRSWKEVLPWDLVTPFALMSAMPWHLAQVVAPAVSK